MRKKMKISKTAVFLTNEHHSNQNKTVASDFRILFCYVIVHAKRLCELNARENCIKEGLNLSGDIYKAISQIFVVITYI